MLSQSGPSTDQIEPFSRTGRVQITDFLRENMARGVTQALQEKANGNYPVVHAQQRANMKPLQQRQNFEAYHECIKNLPSQLTTLIDTSKLLAIAEQIIKRQDINFELSYTIERQLSNMLSLKSWLEYDGNNHIID